MVAVNSSTRIENVGSRIDLERGQLTFRFLTTPAQALVGVNETTEGTSRYVRHYSHLGFVAQLLVMEETGPAVATITKPPGGGNEWDATIQSVVFDRSTEQYYSTGDPEPVPRDVVRLTMLLSGSERTPAHDAVELLTTPWAELH